MISSWPTSAAAARTPFTICSIVPRSLKTGMTTEIFIYLKYNRGLRGFNGSESKTANQESRKGRITMRSEGRQRFALTSILSLRERRNRKKHLLILSKRNRQSGRRLAGESSDCTVQGSNLRPSD